MALRDRIAARRAAKTTAPAEPEVKAKPKTEKGKTVEKKKKSFFKKKSDD